MSKDIKAKRREYIRQRIEKVKNKGTEVQRIAEELFISKDTVYRDLRSDKHQL
jgi:DeoR/GlpR family transcriptional regulator of sugar metabolism